MQASNLYTRDDGIKAYTRMGLYFYDPLIMGAVTRHVWDCPSDVFVAFYRQHASSNHADIGVGTGYCLDRCGLVAGESRLALIDLQPNCLEYAGRRLARYQPEKYLWEAGAPFVGIEPFDSIGLGGILHCLPGDMRQKGLVFDAIKSIATQGASIFGYTLVNDAIQRRVKRRAVFSQFHRLRIINCEQDSVATLERALSDRFDDFRIDLVGCFAFFNAVVSHH